MEFKSLKIGKYEIKYPIIQGGMGLGISWDKLAGTVSANNALGDQLCWHRILRPPKIRR